MFNILQVLDDHTEYISSEQLVELLKDPTISQVKKLLCELKTYIEECYPEQEVSLIISKRNGVKLQRDSDNNLQKLFNYIVSKNLAYSVYRTLLFERSVSTSEFCETQFVSLSTLQRKIKEINTSLDEYGLHITLSQQLNLQGKESTIRCFSFILLYMMHQANRFQKSIGLMHWMTTWIWLKKSIKISLNFLPFQEEILGIHLFITNSAVQTGHNLDFSEESFPYFDAIHFPKKPEFLSEWQDEDWQFLLLMAHNSNLTNYEIPLDFSGIEFTELKQDFNTWIRLFFNTLFR